MDLYKEALHRRLAFLHLGFRSRRLVLFRPGLSLALRARGGRGRESQGEGVTAEVQGGLAAREQGSRAVEQSHLV